MTGLLLLIAALCIIAYKLGQSTERIESLRERGPRYGIPGGEIPSPRSRSLWVGR
jgi:hypothetical protein